jgi:hypothetical protein
MWPPKGRKSVAPDTVAVPGSASCFTIAVPAAVPSLFQSSRVWPPPPLE